MINTTNLKQVATYFNCCGLLLGYDVEGYSLHTKVYLGDCIMNVNVFEIGQKKYIADVYIKNRHYQFNFSRMSTLENRCTKLIEKK